MIKSEKIKIGAVYFFLIAGGAWHILDVFQFLMSVMAGPLLIGLAIWLFFEYYTLLKIEDLPVNLQEKTTSNDLSKIFFPLRAA